MSREEHNEQQEHVEHEDQHEKINENDTNLSEEEITKLKTEWEKIQIEQSKKIILEDCDEISEENLKYIGGLDINY